MTIGRVLLSSPVIFHHNFFNSVDSCSWTYILIVAVPMAAILLQGFQALSYGQPAGQAACRNDILKRLIKRARMAGGLFEMVRTTLE